MAKQVVSPKKAANLTNNKLVGKVISNTNTRTDYGKRSNKSRPKRKKGKGKR